MVEKSKGTKIGTIVLVSLVVAVIASVATATITGNYIKVTTIGGTVQTVYTKAEIDTKLKNPITYQSVFNVLNHCKLAAGNVIGSTEINNLVVGSSNMDECDEICGTGNGNYCIGGFIGTEDRNTEEHVMNYPLECRTKFGKTEADYNFFIGREVHCVCCSL